MGLRNRIIFVIILIVLLCVSVGLYLYLKQTGNEEPDVLVKTNQGTVRGRKQYTVFNNVPYYSFTGIPFAKPPTGPLRFKEPVPINSWNGVLDATKFGSDCLQISYVGVINGSEDCLFVNIFTPQFSSTRKYPVIVYIYGGGFTKGQSTIYGADFMIEEDVLLVTLNYRAGACGFLTVFTENAPGNVGIKDQWLALKWVNENIQLFGGDPHNVTLAGSSAGAASTMYHMLSPLSKGLFSKAIISSGSSMCPWAMTDQALMRTLKLGRLVGFKGTDYNLLVDYLRTISVEDLLNAQNLIIDYEYQDNCLDFPFLPVVEKEGTSNMTFISKTSREYFENAEVTLMPAMFGMNMFEGSIALKDNFRKIDSFGFNYSRFVPKELKLERGSSAFENVSNDIKSFYFHNEPVDRNHLKLYVNVCSDVGMVLEFIEAANYLINLNSTVYMYKFEFVGKLGQGKQNLLSKRPDLHGLPHGTYHADDIGYLLSNPLCKSLDKNSDEVKMTKIMASLWANFAKFSYPIGDNLNITLEKPTRNHMEYLRINSRVTVVKEEIFPERMGFWRNEIKKYGPKK